MKLNPFNKPSEYEKAYQAWLARVQYLSEHGPVKEYLQLLGNPPQPEWVKKATKHGR